MKVSLNTNMIKGHQYSMPVLQKSNNSVNESYPNHTGTGLSTYPNNYYIQQFKGKSISFGNDCKVTEAWDSENFKYVYLHNDEEDSNPVEYAKNWNRDSRRREFDILTSKALVWKIFGRDKIKEAYITAFQNERDRVNTIREKYLNEKAVKTEEEIRELNIIKEINSRRAQFRDDTSSINSAIAGYQTIKDIIVKDFIDASAREKYGKDVIFPKGVLFFGPIGTGKTILATAITNQANFNPIELDPVPENFETEVRSKLEEAKKLFLETGQRSIIILDENGALEDTKSNARNILFMKSVLNECSNRPDKRKHPYACATTFIITTNRPLEITDEILHRSGKLNLRIPIGPASKEDIKAVLKHHLKIEDKEKNLDPDTAIDYDFFADYMAVSDEEGAYSNDKIQSIIHEAYGLYLDYNKQKSFNDCLMEQLDNDIRDIKPKRLKSFKEEVKEVCSNKQLREENK